MIVGTLVVPGLRSDLPARPLDHRSQLVRIVEPDMPAVHLRSLINARTRCSRVRFRNTSGSYPSSSSRLPMTQVGAQAGMIS